VNDRADWVANILLFVPLSFLALGALTVDTRSRVARFVAAVPVVVGCMGLSVLIEFVQIWFPTRTVSLNDIVAESIGGVIGVTIWLAMGQTLTAWVRSYSAQQGARSQFNRLLEFYL